MKIAAVIVTYNRLDMLKEVLDAFDNQIKQPDYLIVVNNASTDNTSEFLELWSKRGSMSKIVITTSENIGGSGGFYVGTEKAIQLGADWIWVSDDDAIPNLDVFAKAYEHINNINWNEVSAICTEVRTNGEISLSNRSIRKNSFFKFKLIHVPAIEYENRSFECDNFSYVGVLMNKIALDKVGLINKDYFIWRDDVEHSWMIRTWRFRWLFQQFETSFVRIAPENKSDIKHRNGEQTLDINEILKHVDHTLLSPQATWDEIRQICDDAIKYHTASVCIPPSYVSQASKYLGERVKVCTVIGFPNGYSTTAVKAFETEDALANGAKEIDMVINIGWLKDKRYELIEDEIKKLKSICKDKVLKVIIETCFLTDDEKIRMCDIVTSAGADYIKTSTGFGTAGATFDDIKLFSEHIGEGVKMKAAGGISSLDDAERFLELGADRLGTSRVVKLIKAMD